MTKKKYLRDGRAPVPKERKTSVVMSANRGRDTGPELLFRRALRKVGLKGYRSHFSIAGRPDIVFPKQKIAIFIHGCFWHRCPKCRFPLPKTHRTFWRAKFQRNIERDKRKVKGLKRLGWRVVVIWEHEIKNNPLIPARRLFRSLAR